MISQPYMANGKRDVISSSYQRNLIPHAVSSYIVRFLSSPLTPLWVRDGMCFHPDFNCNDSGNADAALLASDISMWR